MSQKYFLYYFLLFINSISIAQPFNLDVTYGNSGINNTNVSLETSIILNDNKILVPYKLSPSYPYSSPAIGIRKFNSDGTLDMSFGTNGVGLYTPTSFADRFEIYGVKVQPDGKIVIVGQTHTVGGFAYYYNFFIFRFNSNGTTDTTFGTNGLVKYSINTFNTLRERFLDVAIDNNNRIIAVGYTTADVDSKTDALAIRFDSNGVLDTTFATNGVLKLNIPDSDYFSQIHILDDSKILLIGGTTLTSTNQDFLIAKIDDLGVFDTTFGTNGKSSIDFNLGVDSPSKLFFKPNDKMMIVGTSTINTLSSRAAFAQINSDGSLDNSFSTDGKNVTYIPVPNHYNIGAPFIDVLPDNKYIITSTTKRNDNSTNNYDYAVARINEDTTLDNSFSNNGVYVNVITATNEYARNIYVQSDGKIVVLVNGTIYRYLGSTVLTNQVFNNETDRITIFPNPFNEIIQIKSLDELKKIEVFDIQGKKIREQNIDLEQIVLSSLENGIYFLKITTENQVIYKKIIKN